MAQPNEYEPTTDFSQEEASGVAGRSTVRTSSLDTEFDNIATSINQLITNIGLIQRDDGELLDGVVKLHSLSTTVLLMLGSNGFTIPATGVAWGTARAYVVKDIVTNGTGTYVCAVAHTSGVFATDLAAGKWVAIFDSANYAAANVSFTPTGTVSATNVQSAIAEVATESQVFIQSGSGATAGTNQDELRVRVRPEQFGTAPGALELAIAALPATGGTVELGLGTYGPLTNPITKAGVKIVGKKRPYINAGATALEGGSIIKGPVIYKANDLEFRDLGIDSGSDVCTALYAGVAQEGLVCSVTYLAGLPQFTGLVVDNVISIVKSAASAVHAFAAEGYTRAFVNNLETQYGVHGQAYKLLDSQITNIRSRGNSNEGVVIKSDATRQCKRCTFNGINVAVYGAADTVNGIDIQAQGNENVEDIIITNALCHGLNGSGFLLSSSAGSTIKDITIANSHFSTNTQYGAAHSGVCQRIRYEGCTANGNTINGFTDDANTSDSSYTACNAVSNANGFVFFGTRVDTVACTANSNTGYGFYAKVGATIYRLANRGTGNGTALYGGDLGTATIFYNRQTPDAVTAPALAGAWVNFDAATNTKAGYYIDDERVVHLEGLVKSGAGNIFTLPAGFRPPKFVRFPVTTLSGVTVTLGEVTISAAGVVNLAVGGTDYVCLDGIHFRTYGSL